MWELILVIVLAAAYIGSQLERRNNIEQTKLNKKLDREDNTDFDGNYVPKNLHLDK